MTLFKRNIEVAAKAFRARPITGVLWAMALVLIPLSSYFGRNLQNFLVDSIGRGGVAWMLGAIVFAMAAASGWFLARRKGLRGLLHLIWMILLFAALMLYLKKHPERWYHIPLFGTFGFLSVRFFSVRTGAEIAFAFSFLDELFQHYLANRVGDFEDVVINVVCAAAGILFYMALKKPEESPGSYPEKSSKTP